MPSSMSMPSPPLTFGPPMSPGILDCRAAYEALPKVVEVMGAELHWSAARKHKEFEDGVEYLKGMGLRLDQQ